MSLLSRSLAVSSGEEWRVKLSSSSSRVFREVSIAELFKKIFPNLSLGAAEITSATYQMIQPRLTLAAHLFSSWRALRVCSRIVCYAAQPAARTAFG